MPEAESARVLLEAALALRMGDVDRAALIHALGIWRGDRRKRLSVVLAERGLLDEPRRRKLEAAVAAALEKSRGDLDGALGAAGPVVGELSRHVAPDSGSFETLGDMPAAGDESSWYVGAEPSEGAPPGRDAPPSGDSSWYVGAEPSGAAPAGAERRARPPAVDGGPETVAAPSGSSAPAAARPQPADDPFSTLADAPDPADPGATIASGGPPPRDEATVGVALGASGSQGAASDAGRPPRGGTADTLRFHILRPHARGGLGQVYVARDEELNREVALKEILAGHAHHDESRARFLIEAEVTGGLEHPGIVPVYGLGQYPDGRPYYAMRFIRGHTLKEAIDRHHDPEAARRRPPGEHELEFRKLLNQLIAVCNAMSYAHSRGVLHRDLKPGNVMIGAFGETLVVDWGLAKFQEDDEGPRPPSTGDSLGRLRPMSAGATSRTHYGTTVGTPQFMSPEQAEGKLDELGPPSDVYSLGAILYVILTGSAPFLDKQLYVVLDKVRRGDFPRPRALNRGIDPALEAICLKAMARDVADRYPTATALADDLEHWLADEPVGVYREPLRRRAWRWAKRHRTAVSSLAALLITGLVSLGVYSELIRREQQRTNLLYLMAHSAIDRMLTEFGEEDLADIPQMEPVRKRMLAEARDFYEALRRAYGDDSRNPADLALADLRLGDIQTLLGEDKGAEERYGKAIGALERLLPQGPIYRRFFARAHHARGVLLRQLGRATDAEADLKRALELRQALATDDPGDLDRRRDRVDTLYQLAALRASLDRDDEARRDYEEVVREQTAIASDPRASEDDRRRLGRFLNNQANLLKKSASGDGKAGGAAQGVEGPEAIYRRAAEIQERVVRESPRPVAIYAHELAKTYANLHNLLAERRAFEEAEEQAGKGLALARKLADDFRKTPEFQFQLASATLDRGEVLRRRRKLDDARASLDEAVDRATPLVRDHPDRRRYRSTLALALIDRGALAFDEGRDADAEADFERAAETLAPLVAAAEPLPEDRRDLATARLDLGRVRARTGRPDAAEADFLLARDALKPLAEAANPRPDDLRSLGDVHYDLARARIDAGRAEDGDRDLDEATRLHERAAGAGAASESDDVPPLWRDLRLKVDRLRTSKRYVDMAETAARLPALRPGHRDSVVIAARALAGCAFPAVHAGAPDADDRARAFADRASATLRDAASRGLLDADSLADELKLNVYLPIRDREDVRAILRDLRREPTTRPA